MVSWVSCSGILELVAVDFHCNSFPLCVIWFDYCLSIVDEYRLWVIKLDRRCIFRGNFFFHFFNFF